MGARELKVAAVVPALNEDETIGEVVAVLKQSPLIDQVIVVSDGSTDTTAQCARSAGADIVHEFPWRHGKGAAMEEGVKLTDAQVIFFCDADLKGLQVTHIASLVQPVLSGQRVMNVGLRDRGILITTLMRFLPLIGGERALLRKLIHAIPSEYLRGWKIESALNYYCRVNGLLYGKELMRGVSIRRKMQKFGFWTGLREYGHMFMQVAKAMVEVRRNRAVFLNQKPHETHQHP